MSKGNKTTQAAPDYSPVAQANKEAAELSAQVAREQLDWAKEQYAQDREITDAVIDEMLATQESESAAAAADRVRYQEVFQPIEDQLIADANSYGSKQRVELEASRASAAVSSAFDAQRKAAQANLEGMGVDPSQTRAAALDVNTRISQAAAVAGAENQSRLNTENTARALRGEAINIGKGYPGQIAQAYGTAQSAGSGAVGATNQTTQTGANTMGTGLGWQQSLNSTLGNWGGNLTSQIGTATQANTQAAGQKNNMFGTIAGLAVRGAAAYFTGGASELTGAGGAISSGISGRAYGGEVPLDPADPEGRLDRQAIRVSGGEYVVPASVVLRKGTDFFDRLVEKHGNTDDQSAAQERQRGVPAGQERVAIQGAAA